MKNRYGDEYSFVKVDDNTYTIAGDLMNWRFGGCQGQEQMDFSNLGFVDPSGGPFIQLGASIDGRKIKRISASGDFNKMPTIMFEVE
jgi:hypothetical protein